MDHPTEREWASIAEHTRASNFTGDLLRMPPYPLILTLRTLVGSAEVVHCITYPLPVGGN